MDENGDAEGSYSLLSIHKIPDASPIGLAWQQVGRFQFDVHLNKENKDNNARHKIPVSSFIPLI